jgi:hypothetical protein
VTRIERLLSELEPRWPETPDPWPAVAARLTETPRRTLVPRIPAMAAVLIALLALGWVVTTTLPVVAEGLGIGVVDIKTGPVEAAADSLRLGRPVAGTAGVPVPQLLGPPDAAYEGGAVGWLVYRPRPDLPEVLATGVGALVARVEGEGILEKVVDSTVTSRTDVTVRGVPAVWLEGASHELLVRRVDGGVVSTRGRLAGNTLLWVEDGVTYRLELALPLDAALRIAESMEP